MNIRHTLLAALLKDSATIPDLEIATGMDRKKLHDNLKSCVETGLVPRSKDDVTGLPLYSISKAGKARLAEGPQRGKASPKQQRCDTPAGGGDVTPATVDPCPLGGCMKPAVMIDLETMGKAPGCAIASIGAVKFDPYSDWMGDIFHVHVDLKSCEASGLKIDADTVLWWLQQDVDARGVLINGQREAAPLYTALDAFTGFYADSEAIWCNGASFDYPLLGAAYAAIRESAPWQYWHEHDLRTLKNLNKGARLARLGTHHSAMDDAIHQARLVQHILQYNPDMDA